MTHMIIIKRIRVYLHPQLTFYGKLQGVLSPIFDRKVKVEHFKNEMTHKFNVLIF
jgi:hypothetical protein